MTTLVEPTTAINKLGNRRCQAHSRNGNQCGGSAIRGLDKCQTHCGVKLSVAKAKGAALLERSKIDAAFGSSSRRVDPGVALLDMVIISRARVDLLAAHLRAAYDRAEAEHYADEQNDINGGERAFVGHQTGMARDGVLFASSEEVRALAALEAAERERCAKFSKACLDAGIAERQVVIAERMGGMIRAFAAELLQGLGLSPFDAVVAEAVRSALSNIQMAVGPVVVQGQLAT